MAKQRGRRGSAKSRGASKAAGSGADVPAEVPLSDPQEIDFLPRREGRVWDLVEIDNFVRKGAESLDDANADAGMRAWRNGDMLYELYNGFPERAKKCPTFIGYATATFDLTEDDVYEFLKIRDGVKSAEDARGIGRKKLSLGLRLLGKLGLETFAALRNQDLPQSDGTTCRFPATVLKLQDALDLLEKTEAAKPSRKLLGELAEENEALRVAKGKDPVLASANLKNVIHEGEVVLNARHLTRAQQAALARYVRSRGE